MRHINLTGIALVKSYEGCKLEAYPDPATGGEPWTIGFGSTLGCKPGLRITMDEAEQRLRHDLESAELCVANHVSVPLNDNQFAACVSFVFNLGCGNFGKSTLLKLIEAQDYAGAAEQFPRWNKAAGKVMEGLTRRRAAERALFITPC